MHRLGRALRGLGAEKSHVCVVLGVIRRFNSTGTSSNAADRV